MRDFLVHLFQTPENSALDITLFSVWHIMYVLLILGGTAAVVLLFRHKDGETHRRALNVLALFPIALYALDFLVMPLAYGEIHVDKLPFHFCTLLSILILPIQFCKRLDFWREPIAVLCIVTSLMYLCYPGTAIGDISPFCYRVVQTFLYHGCVFLYGVASVAFGAVRFDWKRIWRAAVVIIAVFGWAALGNAAYSTEDHLYDWGFIAGHTFPFVPKALMPLAVFAAVFGMVCIIYGIYYGACALEKQASVKECQRQHKAC